MFAGFHSCSVIFNLLNDLTFRSAAGMSPYQFLIHFRFQKAKELLINKESLTVKAIASQVGFLDSSHFVSTFRRLVVITPVKYLNQSSPTSAISSVAAL
ncbi:helix-turn-helix domain-containing protein [Cohnella sp. CFH 77786]|uniref:helix-turn-helix domain-containing protein n=1 Tax=Cohnella sp. CFH 77786 TaxID=2662265 RepID=UPI001ECC8067|nr:helix-turn-helix domain-containing protein [Cohnella sp. CFH 77786]